jgi:hypothetical protein
MDESLDVKQAQVEAFQIVSNKERKNNPRRAFQISIIFNQDEPTRGVSYS